MNLLKIASLLVAGGLLGCMASGVPVTAQNPPDSGSPLGNPFADGSPAQGGWLNGPLILDRNEMTIGTIVQFNRMPTASELYDLHLVSALRTIVITLPAWPAEYASLDILRNAPREAELLIVLPGYPESRNGADAWNTVDARMRIVVVVTEPPWNAAQLSDLNSMRRLERVIAQIDEPSRRGFEQLQRPLSFRKVIP